MRQVSGDVKLTSRNVRTGGLTTTYLGKVREMTSKRLAQHCVETIAPLVLRRWSKRHQDGREGLGKIRRGGTAGSPNIKTNQEVGAR